MSVGDDSLPHPVVARPTAERAKPVTLRVRPARATTIRERPSTPRSGRIRPATEDLHGQDARQDRDRGRELQKSVVYTGREVTELRELDAPRFFSGRWTWSFRRTRLVLDLASGTSCRGFSAFVLRSPAVTSDACQGGAKSQ